MQGSFFLIKNVVEKKNLQTLLTAVIRISKMIFIKQNTNGSTLSWFFLMPSVLFSTPNNLGLGPRWCAQPYTAVFVFYIILRYIVFVLLFLSIAF